MFNERLCSHPNCNVEATSLCRNHCCLSICENHRVQHESLFLADFENQLNQLETPIQRSIIQTKTLLEQLDRSFQQDLRRLKSTFDEQFRLVDCRIDFLQQRKDLFEKSREYAKRCQQTGQQPTKEDFSKLNDLLEKIQHDLQRQKEISRLIDDRNSQMESWMLTENGDEAQSRNCQTIECVEILDSDSETSIEEEIQIDNSFEPMKSQNIGHFTSDKVFESIIDNRKSVNLRQLRSVCPLTKIGVFGLMETHNLTNLCTGQLKSIVLLTHLIFKHRIQSKISYQIVKAVSQNLDPMTTIIFPQDDRSITVEDVPCPFNAETMSKLSTTLSIPQTPCTSKIHTYYIKSHLISTHRLSKADAQLIHDMMKSNGQISCLPNSMRN